MLSSIRRWSLLLAFVASSGLVAAQGNVLIVGPGGFSQLQDAVNAAQDGDTILVQSHTSSAFGTDIDGKALTIAGDLPDLARAQGVSVRNLPAGRTVVLSRLRLEISYFDRTPLLLQNNSGSVRLVGCNARGVDYLPEATVKIESSGGSTAFASCSLRGGDGGYKGDGFPGATALDIGDGLAAVFDSTLTGGDGGYSWVGSCGSGGDGASVVSTGGGQPARLLLANSSVQGGRGGDRKLCAYGLPAEDGGDGLVIGAGASAARLATTFAGGAGGDAPPCAVEGTDGAPIANSGILQSNPTTALKLTAPTLASEGETITLTITGVPGDRVVLVSGLRTIFREMLGGVLLVQPGPSNLSHRGPMGTIGASGVLSVYYPLPQVPAGKALDVWFQAVARHTDGKLTLGSFAVVTVLDSAF